jgi:hypothetical protein
MINSRCREHSWAWIDDCRLIVEMRDDAGEIADAVLRCILEAARRDLIDDATARRTA